MNSIVNLDAAGLEEALFHAAVHLKRLEVITNVIVPVCSRMGELWKRGDLKIINEHLATPVIRARLWDMLRTADVAEPTPRIVITTPPGQPHELGALTIAVVAGESGWQLLYFGPNLAAEEIAAAVACAKAQAVALSITQHTDSQRLNLEPERKRPKEDIDNCK